MNLGRLTDFAITLVFAVAVAGYLPGFNRWVYIQTAKLLSSSRASSWGSPRFFPDNGNEIEPKTNKNAIKPKEVLF
ncbi:MAG: hypothetical protein AABY64_04645 [Bdellovibrionota bacterium]